MWLRITILAMLSGTMGAAGARGATPQVSFVEGRVVIHRSHRRDSAGNGNVVVWLIPLDFAAPITRPSRPYQIVQQNKQYYPHVLAVPVGSEVEFPNRDPFFHNVFSMYQGKKFDLGLYEAGTSRVVHFDRPGVSFIFCNIHSDMSAYVLALKTPYYDVSDTFGHIRIPEVPLGHYRLEVWFEGAESSALAKLSRNITVVPVTSLGVIEVQESEYSVPQHVDKYGNPYHHGQYQ
jgi:plastocyanin